MTQNDGHGYIYVPNWDEFQHYKERTTPAWIKCYRSLLHDDDYLALTLAERGLLHCVWLLVADRGQGRVKADLKLLSRLLNVRRVSLEPLIQAGFITIGPRASAPRGEKNREEPLTPQSGDSSLRAKGLNPRALGTNPRAAEQRQKRDGAVAACRRLHNELVEEAYPADGIRDVLEREYRHDLSIVDEAVPGWRAA